MVQAHIFYSGTVQGVGFRYTVEKFALGLNLSGWVRNLSDGRVEILVEGPKEKIENLCAQVEDYFGDYVKNKEMTCEDSSGTHRGFSVTS